MKAILTTAFRSLHSVLVDLYDAGYEILSAHYSPESVNAECAFRSMPVELTDSISKKATETSEREQIELGEAYVGLPTIGGKRISGNKFISDLFFHHIDSFSIHTREELIKYYEKEFDIVGSLVHMENGKSCGVIADYAKVKGIPHFCIHNGITGRGTMIYSSLPFYGNKLHTHHYIPGKWTENFIKERYKDVKYTITGHSCFDVYYGKNEKRYDNVFLYLPSVMFARKPFISNGVVQKEVIVSDSMYSWSRRAVSLQNDIAFFKAFGKYQKEVNPNASCIIPFRQFVSTWEGNYGGLKGLANIYGVKNLEGVGHADIPLWKLFLTCTGIITHYSTVVLDGVVCRTPTLMISGDRHMFDGYGGNGCYLECTNNSQKVFEQLIALSDEKVREELIKKCNERAAYYNYGDDGKATERVVEDMIRRIE